MSLVMDKKKKYIVKRTGMTTELVTKDKTYVVRYVNTYRDIWRWTIMQTDVPGKTSTPTLRKNSLYWEVVGPVEKDETLLETEPEEEPMERTVEKNVRTKYGRIINGKDAQSFRDDEIIAMIKCQRELRATLAHEIGEDSKYYKTRAEEFNNNIAKLVEELDSRVE